MNMKSQQRPSEIPKPDKIPEIIPSEPPEVTEPSIEPEKEPDIVPPETAPEEQPIDPSPPEFPSPGKEK
jgi:hypothetical protein